MQWLILQLTPWAVKTKTCKDLQDAVKRHQSFRKLQFFYPATEDEHGKYDVGFGEYAFLEFREGLDYSSLENTEDFNSILRSTPKAPPQLVGDEHIQKIQNQITVATSLQVDDVVRITAGALAGNTARVVDSSEGFARLEVDLGHDSLTASLPIKWLKVISSIGDGLL